MSMQDNFVYILAQPSFNNLSLQFQNFIFIKLASDLSDIFPLNMEKVYGSVFRVSVAIKGLKPIKSTKNILLL